MPTIALYPYNAVNVYLYAPSYEDYENGVMALSWSDPLITADTNSFVESAGDGYSPIGRVLVSLFEDVLAEMPVGSRVVWLGGEFDAWWSYTTATDPGPVQFDLTIGVDATTVDTGVLVPAPLKRTLVPAQRNRWVTYRMTPYVPHYEADGVFDEGTPDQWWNTVWIDLGAAYTPKPINADGEEAPGPLVRFSRLQGEVFYVGPPVVANLYQPAATITTSRPVARWDYVSGADATPTMAAYKIDVWEGTTPGFGPVVYRSGVVYSSEPSHEIGALGLGDHVLQLWVAQWVGDSLHWAAAPYTRVFDVDISPPGDPIVVTHPSTADGWIELQIFVDGARAADAIEVERSADGVNWEVAPYSEGMSSIMTGADEVWYRDVYTYGNTVPTYYRVRTTRYEAGEHATSGWAQTDPVAWSSPEVFIKIPGRPWMTTSFELMADSLVQIDYDQDRGVFKVLNRRNPVVVNGGRKGGEATLYLGIVDNTEFPVIKRAQLSTLLEYDPWLVQAPDTFAGWSNRWVSVGKVGERRPVPKIDQPQRVFALPVIEQDPSPLNTIDLDAPGGVAGWLPWWVA